MTILLLIRSAAFVWLLWCVVTVFVVERPNEDGFTKTS